METAKVLLYWQERRKCWVAVISGHHGGTRWSWTMDIESTVDLDRGTGWLVLAAIRDALEAQLI